MAPQRWVDVRVQLFGAELTRLWLAFLNMTSFQISQFDGRKLHPDWELDDDCPFCKIIEGKASAHRLYEDEYVVAILGKSARWGPQTS